MRKTILSGRLVRARAALLEKSMTDLNTDAGFPSKSTYIYRLFGRDNIHLGTVNRIAAALGCSACEILEEVEEEVADEDKESPDRRGRRVGQSARRANGHAARRPTSDARETALASQAVLAREWNAPEEDEAWADL